MRKTAATAMLLEVAKGLGDLLPQIAFVGGAVIDLYLSDYSEVEVRPTDDIDCVIEVTLAEPMFKIEGRLRSAGFQHDMSPGAPLCRWIYRDIKVDIMPTDERSYGFSNRWYGEGIKNRIPYALGDLRINIFPLPIFIACKFEAFLDRGKGDYMIGHDWEDIVLVLAEASNLESDLQHASQQITDYLRGRADEILARDDIDEIIFAHLDRDGGERERMDRVLARLKLLQKTSAA